MTTKNKRAAADKGKKLRPLTPSQQEAIGIVAPFILGVAFGMKFASGEKLPSAKSKECKAAQREMKQQRRIERMESGDGA